MIPAQYPHYSPNGGTFHVASIASLAAITGQLAESTKALHDFWSSVKDISNGLQWLKEDTEILQTLQRKGVVVSDF